jgi:hypothetical protein
MRKLITSGKTAPPKGAVGRTARLRTLVGASILALAGFVGMAAPAAAGPLVDPDTLQPPRRRMPARRTLDHLPDRPAVDPGQRADPRLPATVRHPV